MKLIGYKKFGTEEEFIAWQKETSHTVHTVMPLMKSMQHENQWNDTSCTESATAKYDIGVLVTYVFEEPENFMREA
jgi:hypothetical protein